MHDKFEIIRSYCCGICGQPFGDAKRAEDCEKRGVEELRYREGDFCEVERTVKIKKRLFWHQRKTVRVKAQIIAIFGPFGCLNEREGGHYYEFLVRYTNFGSVPDYMEILAWQSPKKRQIEERETLRQNRLLPLSS